MNIVLKIVLGIVAVVAAAFVALIVAVTFLIEPEDYRPYIVAAVEDATGRAFTLEGELGLKLLPCCSVSLGAASLASPADFPEPQFASLESASLSVKIWPLIARREVEIGTVTLTGLDLNLVSTADGAVNWEIEAAADGAGAPPEAGSTSPVGLSVEGLALRDGRVRYRDLAAGQSFTVSGLSLDAGLAMTGDRLTVSAPSVAATLAGTDLPGEVSAELNAATVVANLADAADVTVDRFEVQLAVLGAQLRVSGGGRAGTDLDLEGDFALKETRLRDVLAALAEDAYRPAGDAALRRASAQGRWSLGASSATVTNLIVQLDDSRLTGSAAVQDFDTLASSFDLTLDGIDFDPYLPAADGTAAPAGETAGTPTELPLASLAEVPVDGRLRVGRMVAAGVAVDDVDFTLTSSGDTVSTRLTAGLLDGSLTAAGSGQVSGASPAISGTLTITDISPRALLSALDAAAETADPDVLESFAGRADWRLTPRRAAASNMRWQLDGTTVTGSAGIDDFDTLAARFDLTLDRLNADAYLPPETEATETDDTETELLPLDVIRGLVLDGRLRAGELVVSTLRLADVAAQVRAADGVLHLDPLTASLYGGRYDGSVVIDATGAEPTLTLDQQLTAVRIQEVLGQFFASDLLSGALSFQLQSSGSGNTTTALLRGLAADVTLEMSDGVYRGTDLTYQLNRARALLKNDPAPAPPESTATPIRALQATGRMADGVLQTRELTARTDSLRLVGEGGINLLELALDYDFTARVLEDAGGGLSDLANLAIPLTLEGPLRGPKVGVDLKGLLTNTVRETVQQKARGALLDRLGAGQETGDADGAESAADGTTTEASGGTEESAEKPKAEDVIKRGLRELLRSRQTEDTQAEAPPDGGQQSP